MRPKQDESKVWIDAAGRRRTITPLQQKIMYFRLEPENMELPASEVARRVKVSYTTVKKTEKNPVCIAFAESIKAMVDKALVMGIEERQRVLSVIGRTKITDIVDEEGKINLSKDNPAVVAVAEYDADKGKIKLYSKIDAIKTLDQEDGLYRADTQVNINNAVIISEVVMVRQEEKGEA